MCSDFLKHIYRVLKPNGVFHFASDDVPYFETVTGLFTHTDMFRIDNSRLDDIRDIKTDFEIRWNEQGKDVHHIAYIKQ